VNAVFRLRPGLIVLAVLLRGFDGVLNAALRAPAALTQKPQKEILLASRHVKLPQTSVGAA
jgi:hypothetical protein